MTFKSSIKDYYRKVVFSLSKNYPVLYSSIYTLFYDPSPDNLEGFANHFSKKNQGLTIIQVGANDGITQDPIHKFIRRDKWMGVLLEPQKHVFEKFLYPLHKKNSRIETLNAALSYEDGKQHIYRIGFTHERWATGLTSFRKEVVEEAIESGHVERCAKKYDTPLPDKKEDYITKDTIEAISPKTLMQRFDISQIDWLQIDTEGFDFEIIKMFDISLTLPRVIVFEHSHFSQDELEQCSQHLTDNNYWHKSFGGNTLAVHQSEIEYKHYFLVA